MKLDRRLTGGLAWAGMFLVLAIPSADLLTRMGDDEQPRAANLAPNVGANAFDGDALDARTETAALEPAANPAPAVAPVAPVPATSASRPIAEAAPAPSAAPASTTPAATRGGDPVANFEASGRPMPDYISGGGSTNAPARTAAVAETPAPTPSRVIAPAGPSTPSVTADGRVASTPGSTGIWTTEPAAGTSDRAASLPQPATTQAAPMPMPASMRPSAPVQQASVPARSGGFGSQEAPLIIDEAEVAARERNTGPVPPEPIISGDELAEWDSGSLADYLERRGLINRGVQANSYVPGGFFLDEYDGDRGDGEFTEDPGWR